MKNNVFRTIWFTGSHMAPQIFRNISGIKRDQISNLFYVLFFFCWKFPIDLHQMALKKKNPSFSYPTICGLLIKHKWRHWGLRWEWQKKKGVKRQSRGETKKDRLAAKEQHSPGRPRPERVEGHSESPHRSSLSSCGHGTVFPCVLYIICWKLMPKKQVLLFHLAHSPENSFSLHRLLLLWHEGPDLTSCKNYSNSSKQVRGEKSRLVIANWAVLLKLHPV